VQHTQSIMAGRQSFSGFAAPADYLQDDLLGEDDDTHMSPLRSAIGDRVDFPPQVSAGTRNVGANRLVIAIDYGTTFTGEQEALFSYPVHRFLRYTSTARHVDILIWLTLITGVAFATPRSNTANLKDIQIISNWGLKMGNHDKIPSIYSYSPASKAGKEQQWGASISPDAVTMVNTKMELDAQDNKVDELELLLQMLDGTCNLDFENVRRAKGLPEFTWREPEEIITHYLEKVFWCVRGQFEDAGALLMAQIPVDIVITVPVVC